MAKHKGGKSAFLEMIAKKKGAVEEPGEKMAGGKKKRSKKKSSRSKRGRMRA